MELPIGPGLRDNQIVVAPTGDLDLYASVAFCTTILARIEAGANHIVLDFAGVRYLDSSGVGALIRLLQKVKAVGGAIRVVNLTGTPRKVLEMSNIISLLKVAPDVETVLKEWS